MKKKLSVSDAWYTLKSFEMDVVLSSKIQMFRNLANFPFSSSLGKADCNRILSIFFDMFSRFPDEENYHCMMVNEMSDNDVRIMQEKEVLGMSRKENLGIIYRNDGKISALLNDEDHLQVMGFRSGFDIDSIFDDLKEIDSRLQKNIEFAANQDFGYLTGNCLNSGSGLKFSARLFLPGYSFLEKIFNLADDLKKDGYELFSAFGPSRENDLSGIHSYGKSLGFYYDISSKCSIVGSEIEQKTLFIGLCKKIIDQERLYRKEIKKYLLNFIKNYMYRSVYLVRGSFFLDYNEAIEILGGVKLGKDLKLITGIDDYELHALLYRIKPGHVSALLDNSKLELDKEFLDFDKISKDYDIERILNLKKEARVRSLILQEAFESIKLSL